MQDITLTLSETPKSACTEGTPCRVENTSESAVLITGLSIFGREVNRLRVFASRELDVHGKINWNWHTYVEVLDTGTGFELSMETMREVRFSSAVPLGPGEMRHLYIYGYKDTNKLDGIAYRRLRSGPRDDTLRIVPSVGNMGKPLEMVSVEKGQIKFQMIRSTFPAGRLTYTISSADDPGFITASTAFSNLIFMLADFCDAGYDGIGPINRHLINEWNGLREFRPRQKLMLPGDQMTHGRRRSSVTSLPSGWHPTPGELDHLWQESEACRDLWLRYLDRRGSGGESWIAAVRAGAHTALQCTQAVTAIAILERLLASYPEVADTLKHKHTAGQLMKASDLVVVKAFRSLRANMKRSSLRATRLELIKALVKTRAVAAVGQSGDPFGVIAALHERAERCLLPQLAGFHKSPEYWACSRLWSAAPTPVSLTDFSFIRRFGKGAYGQVFAARKEDTMGLFALKMMPFSHAENPRGRHHLRVERQVLERAAASGSPFLCSLRYAFQAGPWLVVALPLLSGGTLQLQMDERGAFGLPVAEIRWIAAQLALALGALHSMSLLHRDVKPSNAIFNRHGYLLLSDFGLSGKVGSNSRSGTRGYWSPETAQRLPQGPAADWWSLGVTLWYAARGRQPFHRRYVVVDGHPVWEPLRTPVAPEEPDPEAVKPTPKTTDVEVPAVTASASPSASATTTRENGGAEENDDDDHPRHWKRRLSETELDPAAMPTAAGTAPKAARGRLAGLFGRKSGGAAAADLPGGDAATNTPNEPTLPRRRPRMTENELNFNTLNMPLDFGAPSKKMPKELSDFLGRLLERDASKRLGAGGPEEVRNDAFLGSHIEWDLLAQQKLVAPYVPDPNIVYTADVIHEFSGSFGLPDDEKLDDFKDWGYDGEAIGYRDELRQFVQKSTTKQILKSLEAPESVLAELHDANASETHSAHSHSERSASECGSHECDNVDVDADAVEYDSDDVVAEAEGGPPPDEKGKMP